MSLSSVQFATRRVEIVASPWVVGLLIVLCRNPIAIAGPAINQFEIKDLEVEVGAWEFQSQNAHSWRQPHREFAREDGEFEYDDNSVVRQRHALELEVGTTTWMRNRVGIEFEKERIDDPPSFARRDAFDSLKLEEVAVEAVVVLWPEDQLGVGLGLLAEYQHLLESDEPDSIVFGPILESHWGRWEVVANPAFVQFFGGEEDDDKIDFTYGAHLMYHANAHLDLGVELYGTIDRLGASGKRSDEARRFGDHDLHRLGPIAYFNHAFGGDEDAQHLSLGVGLFFGINDDTPDYTLKWSVEFEF